MNQAQLKNIERFAKKAHNGQLRKYTDEDYIVHPIEVARLVKLHGGNRDLQAVALLHDVLEDTPVTSAELHSYLGVLLLDDVLAAQILHMVEELTDVYTHEAYPDWNRRERKAAEADRLAQISPEAQTVKYCDMFDNSRSILHFDPKFATTYLWEKHYLLTVMDKGHKELRGDMLKAMSEFK